MRNVDGRILPPNGNVNGCSLTGTDHWQQEPIAVVSLACRLPGKSSNPSKLWHFLENGGIASTTPPENRFSFSGHYDNSGRPKTMASPGGMFLEDVDPRDIDAQFFGLSRTEAIAMDPQQRQLLETIYEGLENAGLRLDDIKEKNYGCFVGSYACGKVFSNQERYEILQARLSGYTIKRPREPCSRDDHRCRQSYAQQSNQPFPKH